MVGLFTAQLFILLLQQCSANVVDLTHDNFDQFVNGDRHALVEFFAPWCGHCKRLAPEYEQVGSAFANDENVLIAKVDADGDKELGSRFGIRGYPTLKFFPKGSTEPEDYQGGRTASDIIKFIQEKSGAQPKKERSDVVDLNSNNFDKIVLDTSKDVLVEFYAPWCGHCKALAPTYEKLGTAFRNEKDCVIARIDADGHKDVGTKYGVTGFPTIKFFPKGNKEGEDYNAGRDLSHFITFLNERCGTDRTEDGALGPNAGTDEKFNDLARKFLEEEEERENILNDAQQALEEHPSPRTASTYVKIMRMIKEKGAEFVSNELARLERLINGGAMSDEKIDEVQKRRNVLKKFEL